jgi:hypothetical protein
VKNKIGNIIRLLKERNIQTVCVEAGHIYVDEKPGEQHKLGLRIGGMACETLSEVVPRVIKMLFIDDYNPKVSILDLGSYLELTRECGFYPDVVIKEAHLVDEAHILIKKLELSGDTVMHPAGHTHTRRKNIRLRHSNERFTCCALDAALYLRKFRDYGFTITVLPGDTGAQYKKQQDNVRRLLGMVGINEPPMANIFFSQDGNLTIG